MRAVSTLLLATLLLVGVPSVQAAPGDMVINVVSNRADLISGGDALVEVVPPPDVNPADVRVSLNGADVTSAFAVRPNGRFMGLLVDLLVGDNIVVASVDPAATGRRPRAQITITNYKIGGPVFSGAQLQPWICAHPTATPVVVTVPGTSLSATVNSRASGLLDGPLDDQCDASVKFTFFYQPKALQGSTCTFTTTGSNPCFVAYDPANPPADADVADFTNDRGVTVKSKLRLELGTMNRGMYQVVSFYDPSRDAAAQGWNGKLLWKFGASAAVSRFQQPPGTGVFDNDALRRGFMVASSSLTDHGTNSNDTLAAETMMMVKERIVEEYGEIRYTIGNGCSGGSIMQQSIAGAYPGLLQGIQPNCSFSDTMTTFIEIADCGVVQDRYYKTADGSTLTLSQRAAINGHNNTGFCNAWITSFLPAADPKRSANCGSGFPAALTYDPVLRPNGVRCDGTDHDASMLGTHVDPANGATKANGPIDNVGIQYGLAALQAGTITAEQFVRLNEGAGGYDDDLNWTGPSPAPGIPAPRQHALTSTLHTAYSGGLVSDGRQL